MGGAIKEDGCTWNVNPLLILRCPSRCLRHRHSCTLRICVTPRCMTSLSRAAPTAGPAFALCAYRSVAQPHQVSRCSRPSFTTMTAGGSHSNNTATIQSSCNDACLAEFVASRRPVDGSTHVVLGNEAADLDSVSCAIVLAYLLDKHGQRQQQKGQAGNREERLDTVPMVNISKSELSLRRDVLLALSLAGIDAGRLAYRNTTNLHSCAALTLVDHNAVTDADLSPRVRSVLDHHADEGKHLEVTPRVIAPVGSCATLVAERAMAIGVELSAAPATMLLAAILLDCHDMDAAAGKATARDEVMADALAVAAGVEVMLKEAISSSHRASLRLRRFLVKKFAKTWLSVKTEKVEPSR